jgi:hypothetical protein
MKPLTQYVTCLTDVYRLKRITSIVNEEEGRAHHAAEIRKQERIAHYGNRWGLLNKAGRAKTNTGLVSIVARGKETRNGGPRAFSVARGNFTTPNSSEEEILRI